MEGDSRDPESPSGWRYGDVVRSRDGSTIGVVLLVDTDSWIDSPRFDLHVDTSDGVGICDPSTVVLSNDPASVAEAVALGLRGLEGRMSAPEEEP